MDGNKRVGAVYALLFLDLNRIEIEAASGEIYDLTFAIAEGSVGKAEIAAFFRERAGGGRPAPWRKVHHHPHQGGNASRRG